MNDQAREVAQRFLERVRSRSKNDMAYLGTVMRALLVGLVEVAGRRNALEQRVAALERGGAKTLVDAYRGVYREGNQYLRGELATHGGGLWFCLVDTAARPGNGSHWVLAVKAGKQCQ